MFFGEMSLQVLCQSFSWIIGFVVAVFVFFFQKRDSHFGNARFARSLFEKTKLQQSNRLALDDEADLFVAPGAAAMAAMKR